MLYVWLIVYTIINIFPFMCIVLHVFSMFFPLLFILEKKEINLYSVVCKLGELSPVRVQPSSWRLGMSCSLHDIWFW